MITIIIIHIQYHRLLLITTGFGSATDSSTFRMLSHYSPFLSLSRITILWQLESIPNTMNHSSSPERPSDVPNRPKRRKVAVACDDCRARKVRCDVVQPGMFLLYNGLETGTLTGISMWTMLEKIRSGRAVRLHRRAGEEASGAEVSLCNTTVVG